MPRSPTRIKHSRKKNSNYPGLSRKNQANLIAEIRALEDARRGRLAHNPFSHSHILPASPVLAAAAAAAAPAPSPRPPYNPAEKISTILNRLRKNSKITNAIVNAARKEYLKHNPHFRYRNGSYTIKNNAVGFRPKKTRKLRR